MNGQILKQHSKPVNLPKNFFNKKYVISIGKRQPMHIGHKKTLSKLLDLKDLKLIYVIGSANSGKDPIFDPETNPLTVEQQIGQFKYVFGDLDVIFLPIKDIAQMSEWGVSIVDSLADLGISPQECVIHFIGKEEDKITQEFKFSLPNGDMAILKKGQWLIEALSYYGLNIWFDQIDEEGNLNISARNLRKLDLENISPEQKKLFAAYEFILDLARKARNRNPNKADLINVPITLEDLSQERIRLES